MAPDARVAVYYAPRPDDPLFALANAWLGRDPQSGAEVAQPAIPGIVEVTAEPRLYGFHATLKPPMRLRTGFAWPDVVAATDRLARDIAPFELPPLKLANLHGFLALRETVPCAPLQALADACVERLDFLRAPPPEAELARRRRAGLSEIQAELLQRWGYPYVFSAWFFHMTLTRRLTDAERAVYHTAADAHLGTVPSAPRRVSEICLFTQPAAGHPFTIAARFPLRG